MAAPAAGGIAQPTLLIPPLIEAGIASGRFFRNGSVVRVVATGRIHKFLDEVPGPEHLAQEAVKRAARTNLKVIAPVVMTALAVVAGAAVVIKKRKTADGGGARAAVQADTPECLSDFEASLRTYVDAGRGARLDAGIVDRVLADLDKVKDWVDAGNKVAFSFEQLEPLFDLVIRHTPALARAYSVALTDWEHPDPGGGSGSVVQLREHLELQRKILSEAA
ncbi:hypothetical protein [Geodermatophilus sp. SYSU D00700]